MFGDETNSNETLDIDIDDLFKDTEETGTSKTETGTDNTETDKEIMTKAVSNRINEVKKKTETDTQNKIARELGYNDYTELQKANEHKMLKEAGLDADDTEISAVVDKLVTKRLAEDPRFKRLEEFEASQKNQFVISQLKEINKLIGSDKYTGVDQLPQETLKLWEQTGNLKQAYLATEGEKLLMQSINNKNNGSLSHLADSSNSGVKSKSRGLTEEEKAIYRSVMPDITEDELNKKTIDI